MIMTMREGGQEEGAVVKLAERGPLCSGITHLARAPAPRRATSMITRVCTHAANGIT